MREHPKNINGNGLKPKNMGNLIFYFDFVDREYYASLNTIMGLNPSIIYHRDLEDMRMNYQNY